MRNLLISLGVSSWAACLIIVAEKKKVMTVMRFWEKIAIEVTIKNCFLFHRAQKMYASKADFSLSSSLLPSVFFFSLFLLSCTSVSLA